MTKTLVVVVSDLHTNSTTGLCFVDGVVLDDGGVYRPSRGQRVLYDYWTDFWRRINGLAVEYAVDFRTVVVNGDITDGDHHNSYQLISRHPSDMIRLAVNILHPVREWADYFYVVRGTSAHTGKGGFLEEEIAKDLGAVPEVVDGVDFYSRWHLYLDLDGFRFDIAHHTSMGSLPWTRANAANKLAFLVMSEYFKTGDVPPDVAIRSHKHFFADSGKNFATLGVVLPAWQAPTEYIHKIASTSVPEFGGVWFVVENGVLLDWDVIRYIPLKGDRHWTFQ